MNRIKKMKNKILAIPAAALTKPPKPKIAATIATTKKINAQCNIGIPPLIDGLALDIG
jgi:hypothetical protein